MLALLYATLNTRAQLPESRTQRINSLRGFLRELGFAIPVGSGGVSQRVIQYLEDDNIPGPLKSMYAALLSEIAQSNQWIKDGENEFEALTKSNEDVRLLQSVPGIGLLSSTALVASVG